MNRTVGAGGARFEDLLGSQRPPLAGASPGRPWPESDHLEVSLLLRRGPGRPPFPSFESFAGLPLSGRRYLSRSEFASRYAADPADVALVTRFARDHGLESRRVDPVRRIVSLSGTAREMAVAFGVELYRFEHPRGTYRGYRGSIRLPAEVAASTRGVFGLDNRPQLRPHLRRNADPAATGYSIPTVGAAYGFPGSLSGSDQTIGILEFGGGYSATDLARFFRSVGTDVPEVVSVDVDGASNAPTGDANGPDAEVELDIEIAGALAPSATIVVYFAPNTEQGFVDALTTAVHDATRRPSAVSISWGGPEQSWSAAARSALEGAALEGASQGVTVLAASGDQGASDGEPAGSRAVDFPASSPYVVGCGGTRLELTGAVIRSEAVWNDLAQGQGATGGGVSEDFPRPDFQASWPVPSAPNGYDGRGVPDVAANADPETGYAVIVGGAEAVLGGTSAAAPLWAALCARLAQGLGKPLGYANPILYSTDVAATFREIVSGNNGGYPAGPGWNPCTGLGTPQGIRLLSALEE